MLTAIALLASSLSADVVFADVYFTEPDRSGECSPQLVVGGTGDLYVHDDDGQPLSLENFRYHLNYDATPGCDVMPGLPHAGMCGPSYFFGDDALWYADMETVSEGEFGTFLITAPSSVGGLDDWPILAEVPWSCGACSLPADVTGDGVVSIADYLDLLTAMGTTVDDDDPRDVNGDGVVDGLDLVEVVTNFGLACPEGL